MTGSNQNKIVDHLFRHQYGKMVAILSKIFGLSHLELIEDSIQDTFLKAAIKWRVEIPENPEAWLTQAAKNRIIDLLRQINAQKERHEKAIHGSAAIEIEEFFLKHEVEDSLLRMIFVACHPAFSKEEQIAFALKAISGFSIKEIAAALLQKEETVKKRLSRARKKIQDLQITLEYPDPAEIQSRLSGVLQVVYLIFNEGFHSTKEDSLVDKELCGEAVRLAKLLLTKEDFRSGSLYALFALLCFNSSRLEAKIVEGEIIDLKSQDRSKWYMPLILLANEALDKALQYEERSAYHYEALVASEHVRAIDFENTNWQKIIEYYDEMYKLLPSDNILLSKAISYLQLKNPESAKAELDKITINELNQRAYLYYGTCAEYYSLKGETENALAAINSAIESCRNVLEIRYLQARKKLLEAKA